MSDMLTRVEQRRLQCKVIIQAIQDCCSDLKPVRYRDDVIPPYTYCKREAFRWLSTEGKDTMVNHLNFPVALVKRILDDPSKLRNIIL